MSNKENNKYTDSESRNDYSDCLKSGSNSSKNSAKNSSNSSNKAQNVSDSADEYDSENCR